MDTLLQFGEWLERNPWLNPASFLVSVFSLVLAVIFYLRGTRARAPRYAIRSINIIEGLVSRFESLEMIYAGQKIENLTVSKIAFWNAGRETINMQDITDVDPLAAYVKKGVKVLDSKILYQKNQANLFSVKIAGDNSRVVLNFDYVDKDEGAVVQILHTGKSTEDIELQGTIKGGGKPIRVATVSSLLEGISPGRQAPRASQRAVVIYFILLFLLSVVYSVDVGSALWWITSALSFLIFISAANIVFHFIRDRIPKPLADSFEAEL